MVRHDGDDSYLVVAADKGTATFSDIANGVAKDYGFWLGDAFASGGSVGYDHKAMGITARGAWVSVRRHFRERGIDCQTEDFTAVGIGDMSGDVFGNGLLCSEHTRLVAAFDHRDIFIDPTPDAATSYAERQRLFDLPRSSWQDYDTSLISEGGGVFPRSLKAIKLTPQIAKALGLDDSVVSMTPAELMKAILQAPVDLLWNGGIGTYVKAAGETNADAGDKANDAIRINGRDLRAQCVGEGGNLGLTQLGPDRVRRPRRADEHRLHRQLGRGRHLRPRGQHQDPARPRRRQRRPDGEAAQRPARPDDRRGRRPGPARQLRAEPRPRERRRERAVAPARARGLDAPAREARVLNRELEGLPTTRQVRRMLERGDGLSAPELSVLLAWTKIVLAEELLDSDLPDDPYCHVDLTAYFPREIREGFADQVAAHPLRREIIVTQVVNDLVNGAGMTFWPRLQGETGAGPAELTRANFVAREIFGSLALREEIASYDNKLDAAVQTRMRIEMRTLVERASRWLVTNRRPPLDSQAHRRLLPRPRAEVMAQLPKLLTGRELDCVQSRRAACSSSRTCPRTSRPAWRCCTRRTSCSASSRSPTARAWTRSRWPGCTSPRRAARAADAGRPDPGAAARRPLADDGPRRAARRRVRRARPAHRPGAALHLCRRLGPGADRGLGGGATAWWSPRAAATLEEICADDTGRPGPDLGGPARGPGAARDGLSRRRVR